MTVCIEQPLPDSHVVENKNHCHTEELVLDGGFVVPNNVASGGFDAPEINAFGHTFRDYDVESERQKQVEEFYRMNHIHQSYDFVKKMREEYKKLDKLEMSIWECCELLNEVVDENLGKVLLLPRFGELPQWAVVGDTHPLGCAFDESIVHHKYFKENPDINNPAYQTKNGIYEEGCGLENVMISWGHDDYMYLVQKMREEYKKLDKLEMSIWECCELLNEVVDESDPDLDEPQIEHLLQSAEAIRKDYPNEDWLHLTALIHDLGKVLLLPRFVELPQWAVVGDTHPLGCAFDESIVHHKYFKENPDINNPIYQTKNGIYEEGCGLENVTISWGHDDYMYLVAKENGTTLPPAALFIIPMHSSGAYKHLMNDEDVEYLKWVQIFKSSDGKCLYEKRSWPIERLFIPTRSYLATQIVVATLGTMKVIFQF
ncbi:inositol oxygenase 4 [Artemisia annua]|uniref:inositol oxygenase n=1 Tax=Artemisia annua TaxID=35608 RepID=A0A2U1MQC1_ARTAN|nr:inositol oxygenase 4 [Artemisia annua]